MKVLVTGGAGFIGSHLSDQLRVNGHEVVVLDDLSTGKLVNAEVYQFALRDLKIEQDLHELLGDLKIEVVYHLAAQPSVSVSMSKPGYDAMNNVIGTINLLDACVQTNVKKVVYATTGGAMYGECKVPADETAGWRPVSPYGISKTAALAYLRWYGQNHALKWVALALANVYGPRQDPNGEAGVIAIWSALMTHGLPVTIYGTGQQIRDFVYVGDVVRAFEIAGRTGQGIFNIGTRRGTSINQLYEGMRSLAGLPADLRPRYKPARPGELNRVILDAGLAHDVLGWEPNVSLERGLLDTYRWFEGVRGSR